jgi:hypothetical protein
MKKQLLVLGAVIVFLTAFAAQSASAQVVKLMTINIDFEFKVDKKTFPAGKYIVERLDTGANVLQIRSKEGRENVLTFASDYNAADFQTPKLVFRLSGDHYRLSQIFLQPGISGYSLTMPKEKSGEKELLLGRTAEVSIPLTVE